jgi:hypothetical protein
MTLTSSDITAFWINFNSLMTTTRKNNIFFGIIIKLNCFPIVQVQLFPQLSMSETIVQLIILKEF